MTVADLAGRRDAADRGRAADRAADGELRSVSIAVSVLDCFLGAEELGPTQVAVRTGIAKSTASRMLSALAGGGLLDRTPAGRYRLSLRLMDYGTLALDRLPLREAAVPAMHRLHESVRETVLLEIPDDGHVLRVERLTDGVLTHAAEGEMPQRFPGWSSSAGRVMAAFDPEVARATLAVPRLGHTPFSVTDAGRLDEILHRGRAAGWVATCDEHEVGWWSVSAPVTPPGPSGAARVVVGALSVIAPTDRMTGRRKAFVVADVCRAARRASRELAALTER